MTKEEEKQRLLDDCDEKEMDLDYIEDQIRLGHANEDEEDSYINELQNEIRYLSACLEDYD